MENSNQLDITVPVVLATMGILILVFFVIIFVLFYQKKMLQHKSNLKDNETSYQHLLLSNTTEAAEAERKKIASNIHDDVGMMLNVLKLNLTKIERNKEDDVLVKNILHDSKEIIQETITSIRSISQDLIPATLIKVGFIPGIEEMCSQINTATNLKIELKSNLKEASIGKKNELQIYRLIKEILNNIIKHADASVACIYLDQNEHSLITLITHNGIGIDTQTAKRLSESTNGIGLKSIFSRVQVTNSTIKYFGENDPKIIIQTPLA